MEVCKSTAGPTASVLYEGSAQRFTMALKLLKKQSFLMVVFKWDFWKKAWFGYHLFIAYRTDAWFHVVR